MFAAAPDRNIKKVVVILIGPSSYDDNGYVFRFRRAVLPSNSLATLYSLTKQALSETIPSNIPREVYMLEDSVYSHSKQLNKLYRRFPEQGTKLIVGLVGVQTSQFPRACDIINTWQRKGAVCMIGGFHVSGSVAAMYNGIGDSARPGIPCPKQMPPEIDKLVKNGVIVFLGEAEGKLAQVFSEILSDKQQSIYRGSKNTFASAPVPEYPKQYFKRSFATVIHTIDTSRGCPFTCSFCTIINVQGRQMRSRQPQDIIEHVRSVYRQYGKAGFFFTDDNFSRNPLWEKILDGLIALRCQGYKNIGFMVQADLKCHKKKNFLRKLAAAGCTQIFMGVESLNPDNLKEVGKLQNQVSEYENAWAACHRHGLAVHAAYIIGFSHDDPASVLASVQQLHRMGADQASFYILTPLPGSEDHIKLYVSGVKMDSDYNKYDSTHAVKDHPLMNSEEWEATYWKAWYQFFSVRNMIVTLKRLPSRQARWNLLRNFFWYRWSFRAEQCHAMVSGWRRVRSMSDRRPHSKPTLIWCHFAKKAWYKMRFIGLFMAEFYIFQRIVFKVEFASRSAVKRTELAGQIRGISGWIKRTFVKEYLSSEWLNDFWVSYARNHWKLLNPIVGTWWHIKAIPHIFSEIVYTIRWLAFLRVWLKTTTS